MVNDFSHKALIIHLTNILAKTIKYEKSLTATYQKPYVRFGSNLRIWFSLLFSLQQTYFNNSFSFFCNTRDLFKIGERFLQVVLFLFWQFCGLNYERTPHLIKKNYFKNVILEYSSRPFSRISAILLNILSYLALLRMLFPKLFSPQKSL